MTKVTKPVYRETAGGIFSAGKERPVVVSLEPPNIIGFRLKGMRKTFYLTAEGCFMAALKAQMALEKKEQRKKKRKRGKR